MNQLIPTSTDEQGNILVSGRDLHGFLEIGTRYDKWFERMMKYGFEENIDYTAVAQKKTDSSGQWNYIYRSRNDIGYGEGNFYDSTKR